MLTGLRAELDQAFARLLPFWLQAIAWLDLSFSHPPFPSWMERSLPNLTQQLAMWGHCNALAMGTHADLFRSCVHCGLMIGFYCDKVHGIPCFAATRVPSEQWCRGQQTPLCTRCDRIYEACQFCRGVHMCTPPARD